jgi:hypothetical protein
MKEPSRKLQHRAEEREQAAEAVNAGTRNQPVEREFATVDELIRHDAAQTEVPATVTARLQKSAGETTSPAKPWWRRLIGQ